MQLFIRRHPRSMLALAVAVLVVALPRDARAHALVRTTDPLANTVLESPPQAVIMEFNEPVEIGPSAIRVFDTGADRVDTGATGYIDGRDDAVRTPLRADLPNGTYTVAWRIISIDGHPIEEAFVFHVGRPGPHPEGIGSRILRGETGGGRGEALGFGVVRWVNFAALILLAGAFFFRPLVWNRTRADHVPAAAETEFSRRQTLIIRWSWVALVLGTIAGFIFQGAISTERSLIDSLRPAVFDAVAATRYGAVTFLRLALLGIGAAAWVLFKPRRRLSEARSLGAAALVARPGRWITVGGTVLLVALLATPGLAGHAGTTPPVALNVAVDALHLIAGAVWIGGLVILLACAIPAVRRLGDDIHAASLAPIVARFSNTAVIAVAVIVATGTYASFVQVGGLSVLLDAPYGVLLVVKIGIVLPLIGLGAVNKLWIKRRLERAAEGGQGRSPISLFRKIVGTEVALSVAVIGVTVFLANAAPAKNLLVERSAIAKQIDIDGEPYVVMVTPNRVGENTVEVLPEAMHEAMQAGESGGDMGGGHDDDEETEGVPEKVSISFSMPSEGIGPLPVNAREVRSGHFLVRGHQLSVPGEWVLEIVARVGPFREERDEIRFEVQP